MLRKSSIIFNDRLWCYNRKKDNKKRHNKNNFKKGLPILLYNAMIFTVKKEGMKQIKEFQKVIDNPIIA